MEKEEWTLGPLVARVLRMPACTLVELRGLVTAQAFEALHLRMAGERALDLWLAVGRDAILVATNESLVQAASRATRACDKGRSIALLAPIPRRNWAKQHCIIAADYALRRRVLTLCPDLMRATLPA